MGVVGWGGVGCKMFSGLIMFSLATRCYPFILIIIVQCVFNIFFLS